MATEKKRPFAGIQKGGFHKSLGKSEDAKITSADIAKGKKMGGKAKKQAILAENFKKMAGKKKSSTSTSRPSSSSTKASSTTRKKLTPAQKKAARKADAKRYAKDKPKRIAAEKAYQKKEKAAHPEIFKARAKHNNALRDGKAKPHPGKDFHHKSYSPPKGKPIPKKAHRRMPQPKKPRA